MASPTRRLLYRYAGHCDHPGCHKQARFLILYDTRRRLLLCPLHADIAEAAGAAGGPSPRPEDGRQA